jgi:hypothetical protein
MYMQTSFPMALYVCDRSQRMLCFQKAAAWSHVNRDVVLAFNINWKYDLGYVRVFLSQTETGWGSTYTEQT